MRSAPPPVDPGSDWRALPPAPFGSRLQDLHLPLHEVLLFDGDAATSGATEAARQVECYAVDGPRQRFLGRDTDRVQLCFRSGRLHSVEISLPLPAADAAQRLAAYCDAVRRVAEARPPTGRRSRPRSARRWTATPCRC